MAYPLSVGKVVTGAFLIPWWNRRAFAQTLVIPIVTMTILSVLWNYFNRYALGAINWLFLIPYLIFFVLFAVRVHRLVLLGQEVGEIQLMPQWSKRNTRFLLWLVGGAILLIVISILLVTLGVTVYSTLFNVKLTKSAPQWLAFLSLSPILYLGARFSLVFPGIALDRKVGFKWAWDASRGNGWRITLVAVALPLIFSSLVDLLLRDTATILESILLTFIGCAFTVIEIAALSLSYRELAQEGYSKHSP